MRFANSSWAVRLFFGAIALLAIPQVFLFSIAGIYPSLSLMASLGSFFLFRYFFKFLKIKWFRAFVAVWLLQALSLMWSPSPIVGFRELIYLLPFAMAAFVGFACARSNVEYAQKLIFFTLWLSIANSILVILFRIIPSLEISYLLSPIAGIANSPNVVTGLFNDAANNVLSSDKSGGLFVNGNTSSAILGFFAILAWKLSVNVGMHSLKIVAIVNWMAVFFTGSKAGMIIAVILPVLAFTLERLRHSRIKMRVVGELLFFCAVIIAVMPYAIESLAKNGFLGDATRTLDVRGIIWSFASKEFFSSPLLGLGFGGWEQKFPSFAWQHGVGSGFPPHNAFLITWSQSGLIAMLSMLVFLMLFLHWTYRASLHSKLQIRSLGSGLLFGALWFWLQAQGENFGILGEQHFTPILGLFSGVLVAQLKGFAAAQASGYYMEHES